jgi:hypothetical protein
MRVVAPRAFNITLPLWASPLRLVWIENERAILICERVSASLAFDEPVLHHPDILSIGVAENHSSERRTSV